MPEIGFSEAEVLVTQDFRSVTESGLLKQIKESPGLEFIGSGVESIVVKTASKSDKVIALSYSDLSPEEAKKQFYLQRIFSTLFPHNFPHFYAAFGNNNETESSLFTGTVRHNINQQEKEKYSAIQNLIRRFSRKSQIKYPFSKIWDDCERMGIDLNYFIETEWGSLGINLAVGEDGGEYYVDRVKYIPQEFMHEESLVTVLNHMRNRNYSPEQIRMVQISWERLKELSRPSDIFHPRWKSEE